jgi:hypothetical protein
MAAALALFLSACAHAPPAVEVPMLGADVVAGAASPLASPSASRWSRDVVEAPFERGDRLSGHYVCAQGRTELTLVIEDVRGEDVGALFEFDYPGGGGAHTPASGSFRMRGSVDAGSRALRLDGDRWVEQPDGYVMVGLEGKVSRSGAVEGTVRGPGCSTFFLDGPKRAKSVRK